MPISVSRSLAERRSVRLRTTPRRSFNKRLESHHVSASQKAEALSVFSPSKVNIFLRIMRRREDGYHDLASLFHVIDLGDNMTFTPNENKTDQLSCNIAEIPTDDSNLVIKALDLYREKTGIGQYFDVTLEKRVPHGAGLGGGSANAATTLWAANKICGQTASNEDLLTWSADIGSDISVFFSNGAAYCTGAAHLEFSATKSLSMIGTGRGEIVEDVPPPISLSTPLLLVKPPVGLSTPAIFKALDLNELSPIDPVALLDGLVAAQTITPELCVNDLEPPAFSILPELLELKERLKKDGDFESVFMTGSGSTIVCFGSEKQPSFLSEEKYKDVFITPARLIKRDPDSWYEPSKLYSTILAS